MFEFVLHFFWGCALIAILMLASIGAMFLLKAWAFAIELRFAEFRAAKISKASQDVKDKYTETSDSDEQAKG